MYLYFSRKTRLVLFFGVFTLFLAGNPIFADTVKLSAKFNSAFGWVRPGETYPTFVRWEAGDSGAGGVTITVTLPPSAVFLSSTPAPTSTSPLTYNLGDLPPGASGQILIRARAMDLTEDPEVMWKDLSASAVLSATVDGAALQLSSRTQGPKVTTLRTARFGERQFPVVMVQYQDIEHCTGVGEPFPECDGNHTAEALDVAVNSRSSGKSLWQLYNDMSFGQLSPVGQVRPSPGSNTVAFDPNYNHKFSSINPFYERYGFCSGTTIGAVAGTDLYPNRIKNGWYVLPGTQGYYGSDRFGHGLGWAVTGLGLLFGIDDGCGPTGKIVYDAASLADPDVDYNDFDTDRDGLVDFFNLMFAGDGGNGNVSITGVNNVWPHKSDVRFYFKDENGETGYVSNDQLRNHEGELMWWADSTRQQKTTTNTGIPVFVRVGPYNVNPESAVEKMSVIAHEYGHSLGLPDFYSTGARATMGSWELMATDYAQFMTVFSRQDMGWIVPMDAQEKVFTLRESKTDTGTIQWKRPDGTPYTLTGPGIHNADAIRVDLPKILLVDEVPSGERAWHSGVGPDFHCPGHTLDVFLPDLVNHAEASTVTLRLKTLFEIEWDFDYGFVLVSEDGGVSWKSLPSKRGTTIADHNPNAVDCYRTYNNGITGVSGQPNTITNIDRLDNHYEEPVWVDDEFDMTEFKGKEIILRFAYFTDPFVNKRGWFIDDLLLTADAAEVYRSDFEEDEGSRLFPSGWARISTADGVDADHAYYIEVRDRISFDKDGKNQSERGTPSWAPGVAVLYSDENHGYGNVGVDDQPAQTIVDSKPDPGNMMPNLDDAAFTASPGDDVFNGCTHIDNYRTADSPTWKLPNGGIIRVDSLSGLSSDGVTSNATASIVVDMLPDCSITLNPPVLRFAAGHQDPDTDGSINLEWTRPPDAIGPDELQEATLVSTLVSDDAENGFGQWTRSTTGIGALGWEQSELKKSSGRFSFWGSAAEGALNASSILTFAQPITLPSAGAATLNFSDWFMNEGDDKVFAEVSEDGSTWSPVYEGTRSALAPDALLAFDSESMTSQRVDLSAYKGRTIQLRLRFTVGPDNRAGSTPFGWYVDDVRVESANWGTIATVDGTAYTRTGLSTGTYHYRVRTVFPGGPNGTPSPWSNIISTGVEAEPPVLTMADLVVVSVRASNNKGRAANRVTVTAEVQNVGNAVSGLSVTKFVHNGTTVLGIVDTPQLTPGGKVEVTVQWDAQGLSGDHSITVTADSANAVTESNEANNSTTATFTLRGGRVQ